MVIMSCYGLNTLDVFLRLLFVLSSACMFFVILKYRYKPSRIALCILTIIVMDIYFTFIHGNPNLGNIFRFGRTLLFVLWADLYCGKFRKVFYDTLAVYLGIIFIIQWLYIMLDNGHFGYSSSKNALNLVMSDNFLGYIFVPYLVLLAVRSYEKNNKLSIYSILMMAICLHSVVVSGAASCTVGLVSFVLLVLFTIIFRGYLSIDLKWYLIIYTILFVLIIYMNVQMYFESYLREYLGKEGTFSGRLPIWNQAIRLIKEKYMYGFGVTYLGRPVVVGPIAGRLWGPHNYYFSMILENTVIGFLIFICMIVLSAQNIVKCNNRFIVSFISAGLFAMFLMYTTEGETWIPGQYIIYILAQYICIGEKYEPVLNNKKIWKEMGYITYKQNERL